MEGKQLTRKEMEELLPDYIFKRLSKDETEAFEQNLPNFPDLVEEIEEVRKVFWKLEQMDIDGFLERKTRNIPVKVSNKLARKKSPLEILSHKGFVTAVAGLGVIIIALSLFLSKGYRNEIKPDRNINGSVSEMKIERAPLISPEIPDSVIETSSALYGFDFPVVDELAYSMDNNVAEDLTEIFNEDLVKLVDQKNISHLTFEKQTELELMKNLDQIDENDFQQLIEELKNVKI